MLKNVAFRFILIALAIAIVDFAIKYIIVGDMAIGEITTTANGLILIGRIPVMMMSMGFGSSLNLLDVIRGTIQLLLLFLFIRIQLVDVGKLFKLSSALVVIGWFGNFLDRLVLSDGMFRYIQLDYFSINGVMDYFTNLSSLMANVGFILLVVAFLVHRKDIKVIFKKQTA